LLLSTYLVFLLQTNKTMRFYILLLLILPLSGFSQGMADKLLKEAKALSAQYKEPEALAKFKQVLAFDANNYEALWNCSILSSKIGKREADKEKQKEMYLLAKSYAERALKVNENDVSSNYVMAVAMGRMALIAETKEKVAAVRDIKKYAEKAVSLNPNHAAANHVLASWHLGVNELNWMERQVADKFYGGLPDYSIDKAVQYCQKAVELDNTYILYQYDLGRIYLSKGDKAKAKECFTKVGNMKVITLDDPRYQDEAKKALASL
jgi:tetratricopeptide (TPR) repeat protein